MIEVRVDNKSKTVKAFSIHYLVTDSSVCRWLLKYPIPNNCNHHTPQTAAVLTVRKKPM